MPAQSPVDKPSRRKVRRTIAELAVSGDIQDRITAAGRRDCPREQLNEWLYHPDTHRDLRLAAWSNPELTRQDYEEGIRLARLPQGTPVSFGIGLNTGLPGDLVLRLPIEHLRIKHPNLPLEEQLRIAHNGNPQQRELLAGKPGLLEEAQIVLSYAEETIVREELAKNKSLTTPTIAGWWERETRIGVLRSLITRKGAEPLRGEMVARFESLTLKSGRHDSYRNESLRARYMTDPVKLEEAARTGVDGIARIALRNKAMPEETLADIALTHPDARRRKFAGTNPRCPEEGVVAYVLQRCTCGEKWCPNGCEPRD